jgi:hypothetical protein
VYATPAVPLGNAVDVIVTGAGAGGGVPVFVVGMSTTVALAVFPEFALLVTVTVTSNWDAIDAGAV